MKKEYDLIIVGSGLYGCVTAYLAHQVGWRCLVIEKRSFVGGNIRDEVREGINVHLYGPHVFHTRYQEVWDFANLFTRFNHFRYCPLARYGGKMYNLPFNMHTFYQLYGTQTPEEAALRLRQEQGIYPHPRNLEEKAISMVGRTMYETLIKGYTEKQWGRKTTELPPFIIERVPLRFTFDNNYFNDPYQGVPMAGYSPWVDKMLEGTEVRLNTDFLADKDYWMKKAGHILYTGAIDAFFDYRLGALEYRSLTFEHVFFERPNVQGIAVINETDSRIPYTRSIEHKHFAFGTQPVSIVTHEFPQTWDKGWEPFYPVNDERNDTLYRQYQELAQRKCPHITFGGRLGLYRYFNMDETIKNALEQWEVLKTKLLPA
mgnify:FL=1